jgi:F0F1-type ATP synthase epsilon subunit
VLAESARRRAEQRLAEHRSETDMDRARAALQRALVRLQAHKGI